MQKNVKAKNDFYKYWGKCGKSEEDSTLPEYHLLVWHCLDVAAVAGTLLDNDAFLRRRLARQFGIANEVVLKKLFTFLAVLHDIGKFADTFQTLQSDLYKHLQNKDQRWRFPYSIRHDALGVFLWNKKLVKVFSELLISTSGLDGKDAKVWAGYITKMLGFSLGHHGKPVVETSFRTVRLQEQFSKASLQAASQFLEWAYKEFYPLEILSEYDPKYLKKTLIRASWLGAGLTVLADWVGSNSEFFPIRRKENLDLDRYWSDIACVQAEKALETLGLLPGRVHSQNAADLFSDFQEFTPLQQKVLEIPLAEEPQLFIIEDIMGAGKTEAALILAKRLMEKELCDGLYFALPTMATANSMYDRMKACYKGFFEDPENASLVLAHGKRQLMESFLQTIGADNSDDWTGKQKDYSHHETTASAFCARWFADSRKRSLLAQIGVGTVDQALQGVLSCRHQALRLLGLGRKVLIVDEVHDYAPYTGTLVELLIAFQTALGGSVILLSATLSEDKKRSFVKAFHTGRVGISGEILPSVPDMSHYPLITHSSADRVQAYPVESREELKRKVSIRWFHDTATVEKFLTESSKQGKCSCWIRNTVADAVEAWQALSRELGAENVLLFHAKYTVGDRAEKELQTIAAFGKKSGAVERKGKVLVATQVVEQSLDIDFDELVTDLAPVDYVVQRAGRLHRHRRTADGNVVQDGADRRGNAVLGILAPEFTETPDENWYQKLFERGAYVYSHHGRLWLTMKALLQNQGWYQPGDSLDGLRFLIESVYGASGEWPSALDEKSFEEEGKEYAEISWAKNNALVVDKGYSWQTGVIWEDGESKTRIGDPTVTLCLLRWNGSDFVFWNADEKHAQEMSQLSERATKVKEVVALNDAVMQERFESFRNKHGALDDEIIWIPLVPEKKETDNLCIYFAQIINSRGIQQKLLYSEQFGLFYEKE